MKRFSMICLVLIIMMTVFSASAQGREGAYVVETEEAHDRLNVHSTPSPDNVIDHLKDGAVVQYQYSDDGWWFVQWRKSNNTFASGYVDGKYLMAIDKAEGKKFTCVDNTYVHSRSNIAQGECANYHIDQLKAGKKVKVTKQDGTWAYVEYDGNSGWIPSAYLIEAK